jgi:DNA-binding transcriptional LysR family regulator
MKNVVVQTPTGDMLVNQMRAGSLDAAVAYLSNAVNSGDELDAIAIENLPCAIAVQPFGIAKEGKHREIMTRLFRALRSAESRQRFVDAGFQWGAAEPAP